jgi:hypothetical protein
MHETPPLALPAPENAPPARSSVAGQFGHYALIGLLGYGVISKGELMDKL